MVRNAWRGGVVAGLLLAGLPAGADPATPAQLAQAGRGGMDISVRGLEDVIQQLNAIEGQPRAQQAALVLLLIKGAGKKQPPEGGRTRLDYHVEVHPDGRIFINDIDISILITAAGGKPR